MIPKYRAMYLDAALKNNQLLSIEKNREFKGMVRNMKTIEDSDYEVVDSLKNVMRNYQKNGFLWLKTRGRTVLAESLRTIWDLEKRFR